VKFYWAIILPIVFVILTAYTLVSLNVTNQIESLQSDLEKSTVHSITLHEDIGFGGLIHNFKNYLIRGDMIYLERARQNAKDALVDVQKLEKDASTRGLMLDLPLTRDMISAYAERLEITEDLLRQGQTPSEIDMSVQYDDRGALSEINTLLSAINQNIEKESRKLQRLSRLQTVVTAFACAFVFFVAVAMNQLTSHRKALKKANSQLHDTLELTEKANKALSQFAGVASHDLRSPIRHIRLFSDMIAEDIAEPEEVIEHTESIKKATEKMDRLVQSLLKFAKTSNQKPAYTSINMNALLEDVRDDMSARIEETSAHLSIGALPTIPADAELMRRVFTNLLENALKYSKSGLPPEIKIDAVERDDVTEFSVSDNGIGIEPEFVDIVFEPLKRLHGSSSDFQGVGIGLALVKSVIESHGGKVWIETAYTNGTKVNFTLPNSPHLTIG